MSRLPFEYDIRSELPARPESPTTLGAKFLSVIDALSSIDPVVFSKWEIMDFGLTATFPLATARPRITAIIESNISRDDFREPDPVYGYTAGAFTANVPESRRMRLRVRTGGKMKGETWLGAGDWLAFPDSAIVTHSLFKSALLAINATWPPPWACAYAFRVNYHEVPLSPGAALFPYSQFHIPWIVYLSAPLAGGVALPPEILTEPTHDGGLLMSATQERLDPANPAHLQCARILADILMKRTNHSSSVPAQLIMMSPDDNN
jgi:hypothetical protein